MGLHLLTGELYQKTQKEQKIRQTVAFRLLEKSYFVQS